MRNVSILVLVALFSTGCSRTEVEAGAGGNRAGTNVGSKPKGSVASVVDETKILKLQDSRNIKSERVGQATSWEKLEISGKRLDLIHDSVRQTFVFNPEGDVKAMFGTKGGPENAPILFWQVKKGVLILSSEEGSPAIFEFSDPYVQGSPKSVFGQTLSVIGKGGGETFYKLSIEAN